MRAALGWRRRAREQQHTRTQYAAVWESAARTLGADVLPLGDGLLEVRLDDRRTRIAVDLVQLDDPVILRMCGDKPYVQGLAQRLGLPVPAHTLISRTALPAAWAFLREANGPVVVKPARATGGSVGVTTYVESFADLVAALARALPWCPEILIERAVHAETCRLLFLDGQLIHATRRRGVRVVGDGVSTLRQLLGRRGLDNERLTQLTLTAQRCDVAAIPRGGQEIVARCLPGHGRPAPELGMHYDQAITHEVSPDLVTEVNQVVAALGSRFASVDVLTNDPGRTLAAGGGVFLEVNTTPGIHHHLLGEPSESSAPVRVLRTLLRVADGQDLSPHARRADLPTQHS